MPWEDIYFERDLDPDDIRRALAQVFKTNESAIAIQFGEIDTHVDMDKRISLICGFNRVGGDFPFHLEFPWPYELIPEHSDRYRYEIIGRLCKQLNSSGLITSQIISQEQDDLWILVQGEANYQYVVVDADKLEQADIELEVIEHLYKFSTLPLTFEADLGNLLTSKDLGEGDFRANLYLSLRHTHISELLPVLRRLRLEAKRVHREDILQDAIDWLENYGSS